jgi:hypothetical protein
MSDARGVERIIRSGYVEPDPPPLPSCIPSEAIGVGNLLEVASDEPGAASLVIGSDVPSTDHERPAGVAEGLQCSEHGVSAPSSEISAVLKSEPTRAALSDEADSFEEEAAALPFDALAFGVGGANILAGRASDDETGEVSEVGNNSICRESSNVIVDPDPRIVLGVECPPPIDELASRYCLEAGAVHPQGPPARCGTEQVEHF